VRREELPGYVAINCYTDISEDITLDSSILPHVLFILLGHVAIYALVQITEIIIFSLFVIIDGFSICE
jgi:hypothetical protein